MHSACSGSDPPHTRDEQVAPESGSRDNDSGNDCRDYVKFVRRTQLGNGKLGLLEEPPPLEIE